MALFLLKSKTVVRELTVATGNNRDTIHELFFRYKVRLKAVSPYVMFNSSNRGFDNERKRNQ